MNTPISEQVRLIKQSFRQLMDGAVAQSMRDKGVSYPLNWGVTLPRLRAMAQELGQHYHLALALWRENVRECRILATMTMPPDQLLPEVADLWMEQTDTVELAEQAAMNLYCRLPYAPRKAYEWIASEHPLYRLCGFHVLSRLFMEGREPNERGINEFLDQALAALSDSEPLSVRKAALNSLQRFASLGLVYRRMVESILNQAQNNVALSDLT